MIAKVRRRAASSDGLGIGTVCASLLPMGALTQEELADFDEHGFVRLPGFADAGTCDAMLADVIEVTRAQATRFEISTPGSRMVKRPATRPPST
jgi:hypothetical protein